jgi:hypothetical protein
MWSFPLGLATWLVFNPLVLDGEIFHGIPFS